MKLPILICILMLLSIAPQMDAWGKQGHMMLCKIAEQYLTEKTRSAVLALLPDSANGDLASVCPWADQVRFRYRWSSPLHYANTPQVCNYKFSRDCHDSKNREGRCVVAAVNNYTEQLRGYGDPSNTYNLTESLMFLAHFAGDVHQPLHVGFDDDDGGNTIVVHWYRRKTNLHHVWDNSIIETAMKDVYDNNFDTMVEALKTNITNDWSDQVEHWENCRNKRDTCANSYAGESIELACRYAYKDVEQDITLGDDYFYSRLPIVEKRLAQAGVRLALILNRIFDENSSIQSILDQIELQKKDIALSIE